MRAWAPEITAVCSSSATLLVMGLAWVAASAFAIWLSFLSVCLAFLLDPLPLAAIWYCLGD